MKYLLVIFGGAVLVVFLIRLLIRSFDKELLPDRVEQALLEVTKKKKRKKSQD